MRHNCLFCYFVNTSRHFDIQHASGSAVALKSDSQEHKPDIRDHPDPIPVLRTSVAPIPSRIHKFPRTTLVSVQPSRTYPRPLDRVSGHSFAAPPYDSDSGAWLTDRRPNKKSCLYRLGVSVEQSRHPRGHIPIGDRCGPQLQKRGDGGTDESCDWRGEIPWGTGRGGERMQSSMVCCWLDEIVR